MNNVIRLAISSVPLHLIAKHPVIGERQSKSLNSQRRMPIHCS